MLLEILTTVFFANLVIAVSYRSYKEYASNKLISRLQKRQASLRKAFTLLLSTKPGRRKSSHEGPGSPLSSPPFSPNAATSANGLNDDGGDDDDDGLDTLSMGAGHGLGMGMGITTPRREADDAFESNFFRNGQADETHNSSSSSSSDDGEDDLSLEQWLLLFLFERNKKNLARVVGTEIYTSVSMLTDVSLCAEQQTSGRPLTTSVSVLPALRYRCSSKVQCSGWLFQNFASSALCMKFGSLVSQVSKSQS